MRRHRIITSPFVSSCPYRNGAAYYHQSKFLDGEDCPSSEWYRISYAKLIRLTCMLRDVDRTDGRLTNANDNSIVTDTRTVDQLKTFHSLAKVFIRNQSAPAAGGTQSVTLGSLTKVCDILNISAQHRKNVRFTICPQVTQHHIWRGALEEVLRDLKSEMDGGCSPMGKQILSSCAKFFAGTMGIADSESPSWMRPMSSNRAEKPLLLSPMRKWEEVLEMFVDLSRCLESEKRLASHLLKLEVMKEGLYQIRDIVVERDISYKEVRRQDCLVQRNLSKSLGHSSKCLFTLLLYYLYGITRDIELDLCGGVCQSGKKYSLSVGKILTSCNEEMVLNGMKNLNRALGVFKFVWETAAMKGSLELEGHVWCIGAEEKTLTYRGNKFFFHGIRLS